MCCDTHSVGRLLDREVLNLGFSGNCQMQAEVAAVLVELKPAVLVVDCLPNMGAASVTQVRKRHFLSHLHIYK